MAKKKPAKGKPKKAEADPRADPRRDELVRKVADYCAAEFGGNYTALFNDADRNGDGFVTVGELQTLLAAAGVGSRLTRAAWGRAVLEELDSDDDGKIAPAEFEAVLGRPDPLPRSANVYDDLTAIFRELADAWKNDDWTDGLRAVSRLGTKLADLIEALTGGGVMASGPLPADLLAAAAECEACCARPLPVMAAGDPVGFNPASVLVIIQAALELFRWWRDRRHPPAPTP